MEQLFLLYLFTIVSEKSLITEVKQQIEKFVLVQTPQCFQSEVILKAYQQEYQNSFTDDASVVEQLGHNIYLEEGNKENIKITTPEDLKIAEVLI